MFRHCGGRDTVTASPIELDESRSEAVHQNRVICTSSGTERPATGPNTESAI